MTKRRQLGLKRISNLPRIMQTITDRIKNKSRLVWCESMLFISTFYCPFLPFSAPLVTGNLLLGKAACSSLDCFMPILLTYIYVASNLEFTKHLWNLVLTKIPRWIYSQSILQRWRLRREGLSELECRPCNSKSRFPTKNFLIHWVDASLLLALLVLV